MERLLSLESETKMYCMFEVTEQPLSCSPMSLSWGMHELGKFVDDESNIRMSELEILKSTNQAPKLSSISWRRTIIQS